MNKTFFLLVALCLFGGVYAQECENYAPLSEGAVLELTNYNAKGKATGKTENTVTLASPTSAEITAKIFDKKDREVSELEYVVECRDGSFHVDMANYIGSTNFPTDGDIEIEMDGDFLTFPAGMQAGDELGDGSLTAEVKMGGAPFMNMEFDITNRKVEAIESITTPAGTFDCVKLSYSFLSKVGFIKVTGSAVEWVSRDIGVVRSESYNKKGKLLSYTELTKYKN